MKMTKKQLYELVKKVDIASISGAEYEKYSDLFTKLVKMPRGIFVMYFAPVDADLTIVLMKINDELLRIEIPQKSAELAAHFAANDGIAPDVFYGAIMAKIRENPRRIERMDIVNFMGEMALSAGLKK